MNIDLEKIIDEIAYRLKNGRDISLWQNSPQLAPITNLLSKLASFPKSTIPRADFDRVKNQVLDRISVPAEIANERAGFWASLPYILKMTAGIAGTLLIVISLGIGTAVAALQSLPGQTIYPLKKIVENVELKLTSDPTARANLQIQFANNRLNELTTVLEQNQSGEISTSDAQKIVSQAVSDLEKSTAAALSSSTVATSGKKTQVANLTKLVDLSNKQTAILGPLLSAATISNDGQVKIILQQALETSQISKEQAIKNIENAGLKIEDQPIVIPDPANKISASGKITVHTTDSISIGTAKFLLTKDTEYVNIRSTDLKVDQIVQITGEVRSDNKTYALKITPVDSNQPASSPDTSSDTKTSTDPQTNTDTTAPQ